MVSVDTIACNPADANNIPLLDISCLSEGQNIECLAYVQSCYVKSSRIGQPFASFVLKDCNARTIIARIFDIGENAQILQAFDKRPVHLFAQVQIYNGSYSLIINGDSGISVYNDKFDYASFIGRYHTNLEQLAPVYEAEMGSKMPIELYQNLRVDFLGGGKVGAFAKIYDIAMASVFFTDGITGVDIHDLSKIFFNVMHTYCLIIEKYNKFGELTKLMLYKEYAQVNYDPDYDMQIVDTLRAMLENTKPLHLYSHIIVNAVQQANKMLQLIESNSTLVPGANTQVYFTDLLGNSMSGGVELLKY